MCIRDSIQKHAEEAGYPRLSTVTKPYIQKFLKEQDMKPFKIEYYYEKRDPDFESKMHEILLVYKQIKMQFNKNGVLILSLIHILTVAAVGAFFFVLPQVTCAIQQPDNRLQHIQAVIFHVLQSFF